MSVTISSLTGATSVVRKQKRENMNVTAVLPADAADVLGHVGFSHSLHQSSSFYLEVMTRTATKARGCFGLKSRSNFNFLNYN